MTALPHVATVDHATRRPETVTLAYDVGPVVLDVWRSQMPTQHLPVLLIHGWGGSGSYWESTATALSGTIDVYVPDLPGSGRSQPVLKPQNLFDQVETVAGIMDSLHLERVQIVGHSLGSAVALLLADAHPERVERLVLSSISFFLKEWEKTVFRNVMRFLHVAMGFRPAWLIDVPGLQYMLAMRYFHRVPDDPALLRRGMYDYLTLDAATAAACANDAPSDQIPAAAGRIRVPTLLIASRQDQVMPPQNVDETVAAIPGAEVIWIEECGHMPMLEKPDTFLAILRDFLQL